MTIEVTNDYGMRRWIYKVSIKVGLLSCGADSVDAVYFNP